MMKLHKKSNLFPKKVCPLRANSNLKRRTIPANYSYKTADDFMRWLNQQDDLKKQATAELSIQSVYEMALALMAWEDDGGPPA